MFRICLFSMLVVSGLLPARHRHFTLQQALDRRLVEAKATGAGGHSGYCIVLAVRNLTPDSLELEIEPGRRMNSANDGEQDILLVGNDQVRLKARESKKCNLRGYCCQANNASPQRGSSFLFNGRSDSTLTKVAVYLSKYCTNDGVAQEAIWSVSENRSASSIAAVDDSTVDQLRRYVASVRGERLPWYSVRSAHHVRSDGSIRSTPVTLRGHVSFVCAEDEYVTLKMLDGNGRPVCLILCEWKLQGMNSYDLQLPVAGLAKGNYTIEIAGQHGTLLSRPVEL